MKFSLQLTLTLNVPFLEQVGNGTLNTSLTPIYDISIYNTTVKQGRQKLHKATQMAIFAGETFQCIFVDKKAVVIGHSTTEVVIGEFLSLGAISVVCPVPDQALLFDSMRLERTIDGKALQTPMFGVCRMSELYKTTTKASTLFYNESTKFSSYSTSGYLRHYQHNSSSSSSSSSSKQRQPASYHLHMATKSIYTNAANSSSSLHPSFNLTVCVLVGFGNVRDQVVEWMEYHQVIIYPYTELPRPHYYLTGPQSF